MDRDFPQHVFDTLTRAAAMTGRIGYSQLWRTPEIAALAAAATSAPVTVRINEPGYILALYGQVDTGLAADLAGMEVRLIHGGVEDIFVDGNGAPAFVPMLSLFGPNANWFPLIRRAVRGVDWTFIFRNRTAGALTPMALFGFVSDRELKG